MTAFVTSPRQTLLHVFWKNAIHFLFAVCILSTQKGDG